MSHMFERTTLKNTRSCELCSNHSVRKLKPDKPCLKCTYNIYIYPVVSFHSSSPKNPHRLIIFYPKTNYFDSSVNALHPPFHPIRKTPVLFNLFETGSISQYIDDVAIYDTSSPFKQWPMPNQILNLFEYTSRTSRTERNSKGFRSLSSVFNVPIHNV